MTPSDAMIDLLLDQTAATTAAISLELLHWGAMQYGGPDGPGVEIGQA